MGLKMQSERESGPDQFAKLKDYATRERNGARAQADAALRLPKSVTPAMQLKAAETSAYFRARQNSMDDVLRKIAELQVRQ